MCVVRQHLVWWQFGLGDSPPATHLNLGNTSVPYSFRCPPSSRNTQTAFRTALKLLDEHTPARSCPDLQSPPHSALLKASYAGAAFWEWTGTDLWAGSLRHDSASCPPSLSVLIWQLVRHPRAHSGRLVYLCVFLLCASSPLLLSPRHSSGCGRTLSTSSAIFSKCSCFFLSRWFCNFLLIVHKSLESVRSIRWYHIWK